MQLILDYVVGSYHKDFISKAFSILTLAHQQIWLNILYFNIISGLRV